MSKAILMEAGGTRILIESDETVPVPPGAGAGGGGGASRPGVAPGMDAVAGVSDLGRDFAEVQDLIVLCCNSLYTALSKMPHPDRVAVEFGVKLAGEAGVPMLTKASGEANFKVAVEWKPPAPK